MVAPVLDEIARDHADRLTVAKVDVDANPGVARDYSIMLSPDDEAVLRWRGRQDHRRGQGARQRCCAELDSVLGG